MTTVEIRVPKVGGELAANLLSVLGVVSVVVGAGGLAGNWWVSLILGGVVAAAVGVLNARAAAPRVARAGAARPVAREPLDDVREVRTALAMIERKLAGAA